MISMYDVYFIFVSRVWRLFVTKLQTNLDKTFPLAYKCFQHTYKCIRLNTYLHTHIYSSTFGCNLSTNGQRILDIFLHVYYVYILMYRYECMFMYTKISISPSSVL